MFTIFKILIIVILICIIIIKACEYNSKPSFCPKCGKVQCWGTNCEECGEKLMQLPDIYSSHDFGKDIAPNMEKIFKSEYLKPLAEKYGVPEPDKYYYCKTCGHVIETCHLITSYPINAFPRLQCPICYSQLYELNTEKYINKETGFIEYEKPSCGFDRCTPLLEDLKKTGEFSEEVAAEKMRIWKELKDARHRKWEAGERLVEQYRRDNPSITCPYCHSTNVSKIGTVDRGLSIGMTGLASGKLGKQWHCNKCKSNF